MRAQRWIAAAVAGALAGAAGALVSAAGRGEAIATADGFGAGDGLARYVVTLDLAAAADALPAPDGSGAQRASAGASSSRPSLDVDLLAEAQRDLGPGGQVQWRDDGAWYVADGGAARVGTAGSGTDSAGSGSGQAAVSEPVAWPILPEDLVAGGGSVQPLGEGRYLLASDLDLDEVRALPGVAAVEPSVSVPVAAVPDDPYYGPYGWNLHNTGTNAYGQPALAGADVGAPEAWATTTGEGTVVAVVDTGYDHDHPELAAALWTNPTEQCGGGDTNGNGLAGDCHGWNFYANGPDVDNGASGSHGTSVSGTVAAALGNGHGSAGLAPGTRIMPLVVGGGENVDVLLAARAFRYAADNGADVINASFGGSMTGYALDQLSAAVDYAVERGVLVVVAAGNDGADRDTAPVYPASLPQDGIVTVGSSTAVDEIAAHSAWGATSVDLFAPGYSTVAPWNDGGYRVVSGTSFAAPHVAAAAALYRSAAPGLDVADLKAALLGHAERLPAFAGRSVTGGRLDVSRVAELSTATSYTFAGMTGTATDLGVPVEVGPTVTVASRAGAGVYRAVIGLGMLDAGEVWALSGQVLRVGGRELVTDDSGTVDLALGALGTADGVVLDLTATLYPGAYAVTVALELDGEPVGGTWAAPLVVADAGATPPPGGEDGATDPDEGAAGPGGAADGGAGSGDGADAGSDAGSGSGGASGGASDSGSDAGSGSDGEPGSGSGSDAGVGSGSGSDAGAGSGSDAGSGSGSDPDAGAGAGSGSEPGAGSGSGGGPGSAGGSDPGTGDADAGAGSSAPDIAYYDQVGDFRLTSLSPTHVGAGDLVTVTGSDLTGEVSVLVGGTRQASVLWAAGSFLIFLVPEAAAGSHDLVVVGSGRRSVLPGALTYPADGSGGGGAGDDQGLGGGTRDTQPGTSSPSEPSPSDPGSSPSEPSGPGSSPSEPSGPGSSPSEPSPSDPGSSPSVPSDPGTDPTTPVVRAGPHGERLVRSAQLGTMTGLWAVRCTDTCTGTRL